MYSARGIASSSKKKGNVGISGNQVKRSISLGRSTPTPGYEAPCRARRLWKIGLRRGGDNTAHLHARVVNPTVNSGQGLLASRHSTHCCDNHNGLQSHHPVQVVGGLCPFFGTEPMLSIVRSINYGQVTRGEACRPSSTGFGIGFVAYMRTMATTFVQRPSNPQEDLQGGPPTERVHGPQRPVRESAHR